MKNLTRISLLCLALLAVQPPASAQINTVVQTTLSAAVTQTATRFAVASVTGIVAPSFSSGIVGSQLYVVDPGQTKGEVMNVVSISSTTLTVTRTQSAKPHVSGAMVLVATAPNWFSSTDPTGGCTTASTYAKPLVNITTGNQWLCSTITLSWVPGFLNIDAQPQPTVAVASAAGAILPSGPLFHVTGTAAVTGFTVPVGGVAAGFCIIPDGAFTWTTAGNIALAGTAVTNKLLCFIWDGTNSKYIPSYIA